MEMATRMIPFFPELVRPLQEAFELAEEDTVYAAEKHAPAYRRSDRPSRKTG